MMKRISVHGKMKIFEEGTIGYGISKCVYLCKNGRLYAYMEVYVAHCHNIFNITVEKTEDYYKSWYYKDLGECWKLERRLKNFKDIKENERLTDEKSNKE